MRSNNFGISIVIALCLGALCGYVIVVPGTYITAFGPFSDWLLASGARGHTYLALSILVDQIVSLLLAAPFAFALTLLRPARLPLYLLVATVPWVAWDFYLAFVPPMPGMTVRVVLIASLRLWLPLTLAALLIRQFGNKARLTTQSSGPPELHSIDPSNPAGGH